ncbi:hypothetical protein [Frankia sp. ACN1ag]|uniref:hypothetical protein n=1 Tax=Frankia sp. ACN1ag TaxID=102891 RepID=UPI0006DC7C20|nr:hypothetical protein [Frankia sp. ACN1ag]KQC39007.1 hypothetical protein UK82_07365 [Frankia sp. ACN1ag]
MVTASTTSAADPHLDGLPPQLRDQAVRLVDDHRARTAHHRETLLRPGAPNLEITNYNDGTRSRGPAAAEALNSIGRWWQETVTFAEQLISLDHEHAEPLALAAGAELSTVLRARTIILAEIAADVVGSQSAAGPQIGDDGAVLVSGVRIPLTGLAVAGPPRREPEVRVVVEPGGDPAVVAARLRDIASRIEASGQY